jgi:pilus assembly protein Flp/PilA
MNRMRKFVLDDSGVTAIEYAVIAAVISLVAFGALQSTGVNASHVFGQVSACLVGGVCESSTPVGGD